MSETTNQWGVRLYLFVHDIIEYYIIRLNPEIIHLRCFKSITIRISFLE